MDRRRSSAAPATATGPTTVTVATAALNGAHAACASAAAAAHCSAVEPSDRSTAATRHQRADTCFEVLMHTL
ncbi:hypothetical protein EDD38_7324 [Kitasatospora cineracea]|uniref:Uncharacterized protein n=1 Tax=Kitasatospora cineracea TaxID=88074 RepID=A0A3N4R5X6_9ACTN|nr:hypothetical protein EDD38_7324 [Kitasatospora cineracea]